MKAFSVGLKIFSGLARESGTQGSMGCGWWQREKRDFLLH
jgi:hypothetical protein